MRMPPQKYDDKGIAPIAASTSGVASDTASLPSKVNVYDLTEKRAWPPRQ